MRSLRTVGRGVGLLLALVCALQIAAAGVCAAQDPAPPENSRLSPPRSRLNRPLSGPIFLAVQAGIGGAFARANDQFGYGGQIIFRPPAAASFLDALYDWNSALVLQGDYQEMDHSYRIRSGDLILRRYLRQAGSGSPGTLPFAGLGIGISEISFPLPGGVGTETYWSPSAEFGCEMPLGASVLLLCRAQYRYYDRNGHNYSDWAARAGVGVPWPGSSPQDQSPAERRQTP